jgi:AsmA protein
MRQIHPSQSGIPVQQDPSLQPEIEAGYKTADSRVEPETSASEAAVPRPWSHLRRFRFLFIALLAVLLLAFLPPLINLGRYQRSVATSIGNSLGRPVHLDRISLTLLPLPGFTIQNLVVGEDPAFGTEPIIRANSVHVTLRISSLWRRHMEFSTISFSEPSINLVHAADGRWNIEGVLLQASRIETAPTAQRHAGPAPRFPYIEATGARLNFKQSQEKLPFSLVDSDFALWLPDPHQWHFRLRAHPTRTDRNVSDTGTIDIESTLSPGPSLRQVALNLQGQWHDAPLGEASRVLFGRDAGWRGQMNLAANIRGTFGDSAVTTHLTLMDARPADFVPEKLLNTQLECFATANGIFHSFQDIRCSWPPAASSHTPVATLTGSIPNIHKLGEASLQLSAPKVPSSLLVSGLRIFNPHVAPDITTTGNLNASLHYGASSSDSTPPPSVAAAELWQGRISLTDASLKVPSPHGSNQSSLTALTELEKAATSTIEDSSSTSGITLLSQDVHISSINRPPAALIAAGSPRESTPGFTLAPTPLLLGGRDPAVLTGHFDRFGYTLHLLGNVTAPRLQALASALPPLGEGLLKALPPDHPVMEPFHVDLTATRSWRGPQSWQQTVRSVRQSASLHHSSRHAR